MQSLKLIAGAGLTGVVLYFALANGSDEPPASGAAKVAEEQPDEPRGHGGARPRLEPEMLVEAAPPITEAEPVLERVAVRVSSKEQRPGEPDDQYARRLSWLERFDSFERRANMTPEQRERLLQVLADKQEEAILSWEETWAGAREAASEDLQRAVDDPEFDAYPSIHTLEKNLKLDMLGQMRTFLTTKQMVSFRRTSRLNSVMGYGRWLPLDIEKAVADAP